VQVSAQTAAVSTKCHSNDTWRARTSIICKVVHARKATTGTCSITHGHFLFCSHSLLCCHAPLLPVIQHSWIILIQHATLLVVPPVQTNIVISQESRGRSKQTHTSYHLQANPRPHCHCGRLSEHLAGKSLRRQIASAAGARLQSLLLETNQPARNRVKCCFDCWAPVCGKLTILSKREKRATGECGSDCRQHSSSQGKLEVAHCCQFAVLVNDVVCSRVATTKVPWLDCLWKAMLGGCSLCGTGSHILEAPNRLASRRAAYINLSRTAKQPQFCNCFSESAAATDLLEPCCAFTTCEATSQKPHFGVFKWLHHPPMGRTVGSTR